MVLFNHYSGKQQQKIIQIFIKKREINVSQEEGRKKEGFEWIKTYWSLFLFVAW